MDHVQHLIFSLIFSPRVLRRHTDTTLVYQHRAAVLARVWNGPLRLRNPQFSARSQDIYGNVQRLRPQLAGRRYDAGGGVEIPALSRQASQYVCTQKLRSTLDLDCPTYSSRQKLFGPCEHVCACHRFSGTQKMIVRTLCPIDEAKTKITRALYVTRHININVIFEIKKIRYSTSLK